MRKDTIAVMTGGRGIITAISGDDDTRIAPGQGTATIGTGIDNSPG